MLLPVPLLPILTDPWEKKTPHLFSVLFSPRLSIVVCIWKSLSRPPYPTTPSLPSTHSLKELIQFSAPAKKSLFASWVSPGWALLKLLIYFYSFSLQPGMEQWDQKCSRHIVCLIKEYSSSWTVWLMGFLVGLVNPCKWFGFLLLELEGLRGSRSPWAPLIGRSLLPQPWPLTSSKGLTSVTLSYIRRIGKSYKSHENECAVGPRRNDRIAPSEFQPLWLWEGCWFYYWSLSLIWCISQRLGSAVALLAPGAAAMLMTSFSVSPARCKR